MPREKPDYRRLPKEEDRLREDQRLEVRVRRLELKKRLAELSEIAFLSLLLLLGEEMCLL